MMDILNKLRGFESRLAKTVETAAQKMTEAHPREPLEILHALVETVEKRIEPAGRGKYVFPFNRVRIFIAADTREKRARFEAVLGSEPSLENRIFQSLQAAGCELNGLNVNTIYVDQADGYWAEADFHIDFDRIAYLDPKPEPEVMHHSLKLTTAHGSTEKPTYLFTATRINLGRCLEVRDSRNRLIRTNHVAFAETGEPNLSVSRRHAHITCTTHLGEYRLCDDRSVHGTCVQRNGATIAVPPGPRGIRLQTGDEIALGEARLFVEVEPIRQGIE
jgi:hypothetical protein